MPSSGWVTTLTSIVDAVVPSDADRDAVVARAIASLAALPAHKRRRLVIVLTLLSTPIGGLLLAGRACGLAALDRAARESALLRLEKLAPLRPAFDALTRLALFSAYGTGGGSGDPLWRDLGYPGPRDDVPADLPVLPLTVLPAHVEVDAVVVGSGAGGGVAAAVLAEFGLRVAVLEAGPPLEATAARQREAESFGALYLEGGLCASADLGVSILAGACVGGGTSVNWSTSLRLPPALAQRWGRALDRPDFVAELTAAYDAVETRLGVQTARGHNRNNAVLAEGCAALGWDVRHLPRNAPCEEERCGYCGFGCAYGNKRSTVTTYLRDAVNAGATVSANVRVTRVCIASDTVRGVEAIDADGNALVIDAPLVVLAAGALRTPGILAHSGVRSPHLGRHLHLHPTSAVVAEFDEPIEAWHGPMQSALCERFADLDDGFGAVLEVAPAHPGIQALGIPWAGAVEHAAELAPARSRAILIAIARDRGEGRLAGGARTDVHYQLDPDDGAHLARALGGAARIGLAAGARTVRTLFRERLALEQPDANAAALHALEAEIGRRIASGTPPALFSAHQMGSARMAARTDDGVLDPEGTVHGIAGLIVVDASAFPTASGVNPMLTIMALATRATNALLARR
ncbi:MAG: GMC family oxidoreductase [Vulcanimicrobiaceae bacterium]